MRGTPNKNSQALMEKLENLGCDPIEGMAKIASNPETTPEISQAILEAKDRFGYSFAM